MKSLLTTKTTLLATFFVCSSLLLVACDGDGANKATTTEQQTVFGIFKVLADKQTLQMDGEINSNSLNNFNQLISKHPNIKTIRIVHCGGSSDDEINLQLSRLVHQRGINTHVESGGEIASGGVDFFLAGVKRTLGANTKVGVHSWADGDGKQATAYPRGHKEHEPYISYYQTIGFTRKQAEDFYYFTIHAATAENIHFMTAAELKKYGIVR